MNSPVNPFLFSSGPLSGDEARRLCEQLERAARPLKPAPPLYMRSVGGIADLLELDTSGLSPGILARITATTSAYSRSGV